jgi:hypothetical protein
VSPSRLRDGRSADVQCLPFQDSSGYRAGPFPLDLLARTSRAVVLRPGVGLDSCILTVRVLLSALTAGSTRFKGSVPPARPLAVRVLVEDGARRVMVGEPSLGKDWHGHVVALVGPWLVDASIDQVAPVLGCPVPSPIVQLMELHFATGGCVSLKRRGVSYCYEAVPWNDGFLHTPAWNDPDWLALAQRVIREIPVMQPAS